MRCKRFLFYKPQHLHKMKTIKISVLLLATTFFFACGSEPASNSKSTPKEPAKPEVPKSIKEGKGVGKITNLPLTDAIDESMVKLGKSIYDMKCASCHKITDQRVVGPGFAGITNKRKPEWIMNMITNTDAMLEQDPAAQKLLEECLTRMPNQNVGTGDARSILEFMRSNDLEQVGSKDQA